MERQTKAYLLGLIAVIIWSTVASAFKVTLRHMDPETMVVLASIASTFALFIILLIQKKHKIILSMGWKRTILTMLPGALNPFMYYLVLFWTYDILKAQEAQPLNYTWPIILTVLSILFLHQRIRRSSIIAIIISFIGILVISSRGVLLTGGDVSILGVGLGLLSAIIWAVYWTINLKDRTDNTVKLFLNFLFGTILVTSSILIFKGIDHGSGIGISGALYIGLFEMGITFVIWLKALQLSQNTSKISNLIYLSPFISLVLIALIVGESILITTVIGLILIVAGVLLQRYDDQREGSGKVKRD